MAKETRSRRYVLLPPRGLRPRPTAPAPSVSRFFRAISPARPSPSREEAGWRPVEGSEVRVIDEIRDDGAKLVEATPEGLEEIRARAPEVRVVPVSIFRPAVAPRPTVAARPAGASGRGGPRITIQVVSRETGRGVAGAAVLAFTDFANRRGSRGTTNAAGLVALSLGALSRTLERLYVYPALGYWGALQHGLTIRTGSTIPVTPIDVSATDSLRHFYGRAGDDAGAGVTVGVVDSGIADHPDLQVQGGCNTVVGEDPDDHGDNGRHHGTHVAGIIAARAAIGDGLRGVAPGVALRSYRVFGRGSDEATNYAIAKAIDRAVADGCDLINLSLGGGAPDDATRAAIADARAQGTLVIVAAGNDGRGPVRFPASDPRALAISAAGRADRLPEDVVERGDILFPPSGPDPDDFLAAFSNVGPEIALTGPGVGIISTVPGGYAIMSGTSMACPAVTGAAARWLSRPAQSAILALPRDQDRSDAMAAALLASARALGFGPSFEGQGLPRSQDNARWTASSCDTAAAARCPRKTSRGSRRHRG